MFKNLKVFLIMILVFGMVLTSCSSQQTETEKKESGEKETQVEKGAEQEKGNEKKPTIVVMPKLTGIPYFNASEAGAMKAAEDLGVEVIYTGPTKADAAEQVKMIEDLISKGVDAIAVAPNDPAALTPVLQKARDKGILILDWDTPAEQSVVDYSVHQIDDVEYGEHYIDLLVERMGDTGDFAIVTGGLSAANLNSWIDAALSYAGEKYPNLNLVTDVVGSDEKQQIAYQKTLELLKAYPDLKGMLGFSTPAPIGMGQAIQEKGMQDQITLIGCALPGDSKPYLMDGSIDVATLWDPSKLGYLTVYIANEGLKGNKLEGEIEVPEIGKVSVEEDGKTIIMGPPTDFLKDNVDQFDF